MASPSGSSPIPAPVLFQQVILLYTSKPLIDFVCCPAPDKALFLSFFISWLAILLRIIPSRPSGTRPVVFGSWLVVVHMRCVLAWWMENGNYNPKNPVERRRATCCSFDGRYKSRIFWKRLSLRSRHRALDEKLLDDDRWDIWWRYYFLFVFI